MDKIQFVNRFDSEESLSAANIYDKIKLAVVTGKQIYSNEFYTPNIWSKVIKLASVFGINIRSEGIFESSERRMIGFSEDEKFDFPYNLVKIRTKSKYVKPRHKDYLGAIMAMGIDRSKFGDVIVNDCSAYVAVCNEIKEYMLTNLQSIGKNPCEVTLESLIKEQLPKMNFEEVNIIATSLRLDCLISAICNLSRNKALQIISSSKVYVDYNVIKEKSFIASYGSTISIRGYGKYKLIENVGSTGRDRLKLLVKKFV